MRNLYLLILFLVIQMSCFAQTKTITKSRFYLGPSIGMNNINGMLGGNVAFRISKMMLVRGGIGIGPYGYKATVGLKFEQENNNYYRYIGYSFLPGEKNLQQELELQNGKKNVSYNYNSASTLNMALGYNWRLSRKNIIVTELGYAFALDKQTWNITDGSNISQSSKNYLSFLQPGGIIIGIGFLFGIK